MLEWKILLIHCLMKRLMRAYEKSTVVFLASLHCFRRIYSYITTCYKTDNISWWTSNNFLKACANVLSQLLLVLTNLSFLQSIFSDSDEISTVILSQKSRLKQKFEIYGPKCVFPCLCETIQRTMYNCIPSSFIRSNFLDKRQFGFQSKVSSIVASVDVTEVKYAKDKICCCILVNIRKAMDAKEHEQVLKKTQQTALKIWMWNGSGQTVVHSPNGRLLHAGFHKGQYLILCCLFHLWLICQTFVNLSNFTFFATNTKLLYESNKYFCFLNEEFTETSTLCAEKKSLFDTSTRKSFTLKTKFIEMF